MEPDRTMLRDPRVAIAALPTASYGDGKSSGGPVEAALKRVAEELEWSEEDRGLFGKVIPRGARVLIKPNLVLHENEGPWGIEPLVTHTSLIRAVVEAVLQADPSAVTVGDAPVQGCDFDHLMKASGLGEWSDRLKSAEPRFKGIRDFRRTTCVFVDGVRMAEESRQSENNFILFDLGARSLLEPITDDQGSFRVTCYDPRLLAKTHAPGRHQFLVAREIIEADVVINLPKLKTHKKAGITCALKNLIGINGNKEYLPHHRLGGSGSGGDCYPDTNPFKRALEFTSDQQNMTTSLAAARAWTLVSKPFARALKIMGDELGLEGSWSGNDTIWRTCLDLNRILLYGRTDGTLADRPQRQTLHIVDAVVAGQGDGPLKPQPLPLGMIMAGQNAAAIDWVGARLLAYNPERLTIVREAFSRFSWPIATFSPSEIVVRGPWKAGPVTEIFRNGAGPLPVIHPVGWRDAADDAARANGK
ncbi:MAG: DUF362 domain-containing protein [Blastocatellia bacterium]|nr:DUF362 domain-containing protein [Blastocatellia bacterium]